MKILIIDDSIIHRNSAKETLAGHELTLAKSFDSAMEILNLEHDKNKRDRILDQLGGYNKENWAKACEESRLLFPFDVVLTDMNLPMSSQTLMPDLYDPSQLIPYGFVIALRAAAAGAKYVAMVTDTNHHKGAMSAAIDHLGTAYYHEGFVPNFVINGAKVMFVHAPFTGNGAKDWGKVLKDLIA